MSIEHSAARHLFFCPTTPDTREEYRRVYNVIVEIDCTKENLHNTICVQCERLRGKVQFKNWTYPFVDEQEARPRLARAEGNLQALTRIVFEWLWRSACGIQN